MRFGPDRLRAVAAAQVDSELFRPPGEHLHHRCIGFLMRAKAKNAIRTGKALLKLKGLRVLIATGRRSIGQGLEP